MTHLIRITGLLPSKHFTLKNLIIASFFLLVVMVSADYKLNCSRMLGTVFPSIVYDGGLITSALSSQADGPSKYDMGETVYVQDELTFDVSRGTVLTPPTKRTPHYTIVFEDGTEKDIKPENIYNEHNVPSNGKLSVLLGFFKPSWLKQDQRITLQLEQGYQQVRISFPWQGESLRICYAGS